MCYKRNNYACGHVKETPIPTCEYPRAIKAEPLTTASSPSSIRSASSNRQSSSPRSSLFQMRSRSREKAVNKSGIISGKEQTGEDVLSEKPAAMSLKSHRGELEDIFAINDLSTATGGAEKLFLKDDAFDQRTLTFRNVAVFQDPSLPSSPSVPSPIPTIKVMNAKTIIRDSNSQLLDLEVEDCIIGNRNTTDNTFLITGGFPPQNTPPRRPKSVQPLSSSANWLSVSMEREPTVIGNFEVAVGRPAMKENLGRQKAFKRSRSLPMLNLRGSDNETLSPQAKMAEDNQHAWLSLETDRDVTTLSASATTSSSTPSSRSSSKVRDRLSVLNLFNRSKNKLAGEENEKIELVPCERIVLVVKSGIPCPDCLPDFSSGIPGAGVCPPYYPGRGGWKWEMSDATLELGRD